MTYSYQEEEEEGVEMRKFDTTRQYLSAMCNPASQSFTCDHIFILQISWARLSHHHINESDREVVN